MSVVAFTHGSRIALDWLCQLCPIHPPTRLEGIPHSRLVPRLRAGLVPRLVDHWHDPCQYTANWCQLSLYPMRCSGLSVCELVSNQWIGQVLTESSSISVVIGLSE